MPCFYFLLRAIYTSILICGNTYCPKLRTKYSIQTMICIYKVKILLHVLSLIFLFFSVQFSSVTQSCSTLCEPMDSSMAGFPVHHQLLELTQTHVHWVSEAIQPSHALSPHSPPAFNLPQHQDLFQWVSSSHQVAKVLVSASASVLPMNIQDWFPLGQIG